ncbi:hypothetical protein E4T56_gene10508 [Termitomyces sp. T112]|nr:hypothetical protein E4T56_gene10508 [Termitomyces sp. T112]
MAISSFLGSLVNDPCLFSQVNYHNATSASRVKPKCEDYVKTAASSVLGSDFKFKSPTPASVNESTGLAIYDELTKILPGRSSQSMFFWRKLGRPFASMLEAAEFPIALQVYFLTFVYARVLGMMGPVESNGPASYMTFDGSPVELSWVIPSNVEPGDNTCRQVRFAIEPIDPRSGKLLRGFEVLKYLTSPKGSLGLVKCDKGVLDWSMITEQFLYSDTDDDKSKRFFVGFDFSRSGKIVLKAYYIPCARQPSDLSISRKASGMRLWDVDYKPLRSLLMTLDPTLMKSLNMMISYAEESNMLYKPRLQILSMDCVSNEANRLKMYCRPSRGVSWHDARHAFTLAGRLDCPKMERVLTRLETLWNLLFPFAHSQSNCDLDEGLRLRYANCDDTCYRRSADHPTGGLLYYYSLVPGSGMILPKVYLPVSRYCANDLVIAEALEKFYTIDGRGRHDHGWVAKEVSAAYNHRFLHEKAGIHTYVTFALKKNYKWELTSYFSPEVWESS